MNIPVQVVVQELNDLLKTVSEFTAKNPINNRQLKFYNYNSLYAAVRPHEDESIAVDFSRPIKTQVYNYVQY